MNTEQKLGQNILRLRKERGLTQEQLANKAGIRHQPSLSQRHREWEETYIPRHR